MIRIEKALTHPIPYDINTIGSPEDILFFDIETTGLSARSTGLYLIGVLTYDHDHWTLLQFFCEDVADEPTVLQAFFDLLRQKKILISYNGDGFDIPFLRHMVEQFSLPYSFDTVVSFDLFKKFRPLKRLLNLPDLKLKSCERFLGIDREDRFTGGELIEVYFEWQKTKNPALIDTLLLHNAEDIANLPNLLPMLNYSALLHSDFCLCAHELLPQDRRFTEENKTAVNGRASHTPGIAHTSTPRTTPLHPGERSEQRNTTPLLHLSFTTVLSSMPTSDDVPGENDVHEEQDDRGQHRPNPEAVTLPQPMDAHGDFWAIHAEGSRVELYVQLFEGERKLFFADYQNYYYLPAEDQVIHKSLAEFVDRSARKKACAKNCYQRVYGCFLPEICPVFTPGLQAAYRDKLLYARYTDAFWDDKVKSVAYLKSFLTSVL